MREIIKEGIKLNQSLALLPLKAARELAGDQNQGVKQMVDMAEDMVSMPFVAATKIIDNSRPDCKNMNCQADTDEHAGSDRGGPSLRNVWVNPEVTVFSDVEINDGQKRAILTVTGLLCGG
ncbi:MAG: hypothetical protein ROZ36_19595 [Thermincola sp.]|nr:hypothetical protein [Thermincola sp.]